MIKYTKKDLYFKNFFMYEVCLLMVYKVYRSIYCDRMQDFTALIPNRCRTYHSGAHIKYEQDWKRGEA